MTKDNFLLAVYCSISMMADDFALTRCNWLWYGELELVFEEHKTKRRTEQRPSGQTVSFMAFTAIYKKYSWVLNILYLRLWRTTWFFSIHHLFFCRCVIFCFVESAFHHEPTFIPTNLLEALSFHLRYKDYLSLLGVHVREHAKLTC